MKHETHNWDALLLANKLETKDSDYQMFLNILLFKHYQQCRIIWYKLKGGFLECYSPQGNLNNSLIQKMKYERQI